MKKYNRMYACPTIGGECIFIIAKSYNQFKKIYKKTNSCYTIEEFENWGKFSELSKSWRISLKSLVEISGTAKFVAYGHVYNALK